MKAINPNLPLLVPSFSSKGNLLIRHGDSYISDNFSLLKALDVRVSNAYLVSAYDIYYGFMPEDPKDLPYSDFLFVDSGGYEVSNSFESNERNKYNYRTKAWDEHQMKEVYSKIVDAFSREPRKILLSSFDKCSSYEDQLKDAIEMALEYPTTYVNFIVKPCNGVSEPFTGHSIEDLSLFLRSNKEGICEIPVLGFAEKELGNTLTERIHNLISIRNVLTEIEWPGLVHLFGGMEPNLVQIYYYAGADIFDGLSWQRIRYSDSTSLYAMQHYITNKSEYENAFYMMTSNLSTMYEMTLKLSTDSNTRTARRNELAKLLMFKEDHRLFDLIRATQFVKEE